MEEDVVDMYVIVKIDFVTLDGFHHHSRARM
jgi:hypothetical protein